MLQGKIICVLASSIWLTWPEVNVRTRLAPRANASVRPPRSTCRCLPWATSSRRWWTGVPNTCPTETPSWRGSCRTRLAATRARSWWPACHRPPTTTRRAWARCATPTAPRASRTDRASTKTPKMPSCASTKRRLNSWRHCSQASWALPTWHVRQSPVILS